jgi:hypothetical protein
MKVMNAPILMKMSVSKMQKLSRILVCSASFLALVSCTCATPLKVSPIQKTDKKLACKEVILEINEAEHYKDLADKEKGIRFGNMLMPVCWVSSYVDARDAIKYANERIKYLGHIYDVMDCGGKSDKSERLNNGEGMAPLAAPPIIQIQPVPRELPKQDSSKQKPDQQGSCKTDEEAAKYTHQHATRLGKIYKHCHYNDGAHKHLDDY